jgi:hypothetical protein
MSAIVRIMSSVEHLLTVFDAFRAATGLADATVSTRFLDRGSRIVALRAGGDMGAKRIARALDDFSAAWPPDAVWPAHVPRGAPAPAAVGHAEDE